jgi:hypothetical protein
MAPAVSSWAHGFVDISAMALNAAINGSIFAMPDACLVMTVALPFGSTRALPTAMPSAPARRCANGIRPPTTCFTPLKELAE